MAVALVSAIVERLGSLASSEFKLTVTVKKEVQKLARKFLSIRAVLNDAEKRQLKEEAVKLDNISKTEHQTKLQLQSKEEDD